MRGTLLLVSIVLAACGRDTARRDEGARVLRAIDQLVAANDGAKAGPLAALETTACSDPPACEAKSACIAAFSPLVKAISLRDEVRAAMRQPGAAASTDVFAAKVDAAEAAQRESATKMDGCLSASSAARRAYGP
jgi:hypothetical protein